jgi:hypothetical protein
MEDPRKYLNIGLKYEAYDAGQKGEQSTIVGTESLRIRVFKYVGIPIKWYMLVTLFMSGRS